MHVSHKITLFWDVTQLGLS